MLASQMTRLSLPPYRIIMKKHDPAAPNQTKPNIYTHPPNPPGPTSIYTAFFLLFREFGCGSLLDKQSGKHEECLRIGPWSG